MKVRMTMATAVIGVATATLGACGTSDPGTGDVTAPSSSPAPTISEAPSVDPADPSAAALVGDWTIASEDYTLHLVEDGTFVQDYMGVTDFRTGKYSVDGDKISLVGDDGDTDDGTIKGDTLVFTLGTATRVR